MGAFKFRGAYNALARFTPEQRSAGALAFSSGNHAQAIALSARLLGMPSVIVMPKDAPAAKLAATRDYQRGQVGSEVVLYDRYTEDRAEIGARIAAERGMTLIPPFDHPDVMAGQGTAALELINEVGPLDVLLVCVGGGGLISGCAVAAKHKLPGIAVIGVEPEAGNDTVSDAQLIRTMQFFAERMKQVVEPTGCLGAAALLEGVVDLRGARVGVILSGGNVDLPRYAQMLATA